MARDALTLEVETEAFRAWTETHLRHLTGEEKKKALRALAFDFLRRVILKTPVDTGRARGGWMSYLLSNQMEWATLARQPGPGGGGSGGVQSKAIREGLKQSSFTERFSENEAFVAIVNGVRYIVLLEFGSSDQAPAGMMRVSFREMRAGKVGSEVLAQALTNAVAQANRTARVRRTRSLPG